MPKLSLTAEGEFVSQDSGTPVKGKENEVGTFKLLVDSLKFSFYEVSVSLFFCDAKLIIFIFLTFRLASQVMTALQVK